MGGLHEERQKDTRSGSGRKILLNFDSSARIFFCGHFGMLQKDLGLSDMAFVSSESKPRTNIRQINCSRYISDFQ